jgi:hypothetical protein
MAATARRGSGSEPDTDCVVFYNDDTKMTSCVAALNLMPGCNVMLSAVGDQVRLVPQTVLHPVLKISLEQCGLRRHLLKYLWANMPNSIQVEPHCLSIRIFSVSSTTTGQISGRGGQSLYVHLGRSDSRNFHRPRDHRSSNAHQR